MKTLTFVASLPTSTAAFANAESCGNDYKCLFDSFVPQAEAECENDAFPSCVSQRASAYALAYQSDEAPGKYLEPKIGYPHYVQGGLRSAIVDSWSHTHSDRFGTVTCSYTIYRSGNSRSSCY